MSKNVTVHNFHCRIMSRKVTVYSGGTPLLLPLREYLIFGCHLTAHLYVRISSPPSPLKIVVFCPPTETEFQNIQK